MTARTALTTVAEMTSNLRAETASRGDAATGMSPGDAGPARATGAGPVGVVSGSVGDATCTRVHRGPAQVPGGGSGWCAVRWGRRVVQVACGACAPFPGRDLVVCGQGGVEFAQLAGDPGGVDVAGEVEGAPGGVEGCLE